MAVIPIILAGGFGTRLWPLSSDACPKAFLNLPFYSPKLSQNNQFTLIQRTLIRAFRLTNNQPTIIVNQAHQHLLKDQISGEVEGKRLSAHIRLEQSAKNTAPAIALEAMRQVKNKLDPILLVFTRRPLN